MPNLELSQLNRADRAGFVALIGDIFEHSPWVAETAHRAGPFASLEALNQALADAVYGAEEDRKLALLRAHPDLAGKAARAGDLTDASKGEQAGAGLDTLSEEEYERFEKLNAAYRQSFGFPFIIAVKNHTKHGILDAFEQRLKNPRAVEIETALGQVCEIARLRLEALVEPQELGAKRWPD